MVARTKNSPGAGANEEDQHHAQEVDNTPWHTLAADEVLGRLHVGASQGLEEVEVARRRVRFGANELVERGPRNPLFLLWDQLTDPLVLLLIFAAAVSAFLGKADNVIAISLIVVLNAVLGVVQEFRAEKAMQALKQMAAPMVRVRRMGRLIQLPARELVPGDVFLVEAGDVIPADARLLEAANLRVQEASLTGESQPVDKHLDLLNDPDAALGDRHNMVYLGTSVTYGRGEGVVVATGMGTQLGRIAEMIQSVESEKTPLQRRMDELGRVLIGASVIIMGIAFLIGILSGDSLEDVALNAVAIAVAVVPEGLPAVVTIALALGAQRMLRRNALIRKLPAVETLGSVTTIASDKTGTLTENRMTVTIMDVAGQRDDMDSLAGQGMAALLNANGTGRSAALSSDALVLAGGTLASDASLNDELAAIGDPTEGAIVVAAARFGLHQRDLTTAFPRIDELPFDSDRKRMTTVHRVQAGAMPEHVAYLASLLDLQAGDRIAFVKGAVDPLLDITTHAWMEGGVSPLTPETRARIEAANNDMAQRGLRVLGVAFRQLDDSTPVDNRLETNLVFVGMVGIIDPPRPEVRDAVATCRRAGIRPVMITGDHPLTAFAIAKDLGIAQDGDRVVTGHELAHMSEDDLDAVVETVPVFARVSPEHKLNIVQAFQRKGHIAAMTGDGVNDAPALKRSNIGVAMGITGTSVTKEASDMVIVDDNFATIVAAVGEGRTIYDNVRRFIKYLLASNTGELFVLLATQLIAGMTIPLTTLQILWMNLITDGIPALALGVEKPEKGTMDRPPYAPNESLFGRGLGRHILIVGLLLGATGLGLGYWAWSSGLQAANGAPAWNTMVFFFLTIAQMGHALGLRSHHETLFTMNPIGNPLLIGAILTTLLLQMTAIYTPFFNDLFGTNPLTLGQLAICMTLSTVVFWGVELEKLLIRRGVLR